MAPQRRAKVVVKSTRKILRETVQVAVLDKTEGDDNADQQRLETVPLEDIAEEKERAKTECSNEEPKTKEKKGKENGKRKKRGDFDGNEGYRTYVFRGSYAAGAFTMARIRRYMK
ncbi:hypothetical protein V6N11_008981 [Hibiscus sabdariffa]|uniref:Uncharacterized protein n=1 Tax=Hibiscus sabdariffa TaxID=183260 RepID=A0ABR2PPA5_9ROSI